MHVLGAGFDCGTPVVIDHKSGAAPQRQRLAYNLDRIDMRQAFDTQLNGSDTEGGKAVYPVDAVDDWVKSIRIRHARTVFRQPELMERQNRADPSGRLRTQYGRHRPRDERPSPY